MDEEENVKKQEGVGLIIYIALAVIIAATLIISVVAAVNRRKRNNAVTDVTDTEQTTQTETTRRLPSVIPHAVKPSEDTEKVKNEPAPAVTEQVTTAPETTEKTEPTSAERVYVIPVRGYVLKDYTMDMPVYSVTMEDYRVHNGTDLSADPGDPVYSFSDGTVSKIYTDPMMGQTVEIDHGDGLVSVYQNLQINLPDGIEVGAGVAAGEVIGAVGETSLIECAEVPHLHFSVYRNGVPEPPSDYLGSIRFTEE